MFYSRAQAVRNAIMISVIFSATNSIAKNNQTSAQLIVLDQAVSLVLQRVVEPTLEEEFEDPDGVALAINTVVEPTLEDEFEDPDGVAIA